MSVEPKRLQFLFNTGYRYESLYYNPYYGETHLLSAVVISPVSGVLLSEPLNA